MTPDRCGISTGVLASASCLLLALLCPPGNPAEEWDYLDVDVLRPSRSGAVCITCQHFRYEVGNHCVTVLTCPIHQGLIPQGEHLIKRCAQWIARREAEVGWCPEVG